MNSRQLEYAQYIQDNKFTCIVITEQCASYNLIDNQNQKHKFSWAYIMRNLQKMEDYSGKGLTARIYQKLVLTCQSVLRIQHRYENNQLADDKYQNECIVYS
ncbi:MAG: transposase [Alteromonadaceae bacterium]|jgi:transposase